MSFTVPVSSYNEILQWIKDTLKTMSFIEGVAIYDSNYFIDPSTKIPAIAINREDLGEGHEKCANGDNTVTTFVTITLHIPPTEKDTLDPILTYFEEQTIFTLNNGYLFGDPPNQLQNFEFANSKITSLFLKDTGQQFSNMSIVRFAIEYTI